tara:strand:+ start:725 stop:1111 length:387 start_codon:yes stop_codon:yes gene_type:complete
MAVKDTLIHTGRILLALYFLIPGIGKFISWESQLVLMETHNIILAPFLLAIAGITQIIGSISLILNKYVIVCALGFALMTLLINLNLHDFWNEYEGINSSHELQNFYKNLGIFSGLLLLAAVYIEDKS